MKQLLELEMLDKLDVCGTENDFGLLPLSAQAPAVEYRLHAHPRIQPHDFRDLALSAKDLQWTFRATMRDNWDALLLAFDIGLRNWIIWNGFVFLRYHLFYGTARSFGFK